MKTEMKLKTLLLAIGLSLIVAIASGAAPCPPEGSSKNPAHQAMDRLKNRTTAPAKIDKSVTLASLLAPGADANRFSSSQGATITGYIALVKPGGPETCHCGKGGLANEDTHIVVVSDPKYIKDGTHHLIVEVTPQSRVLRVLAKIPGTPILKKQLKPGTQVRITGWLFFDVMHVQNAFNTNPHGKALWRATCWEIHSVTKIEVIK